MDIKYKTDKPHWIREIDKYNKRNPKHSVNEYAQTGEDYALKFIFDKIGTTNKTAIEFGAGNGRRFSNTLLFEDMGWNRFLFDVKPGSDKVHKEFINATNVNDIFKKYNVPQTVDLLSIDIDGNDYWVWGSMYPYRARVVVIEYNAVFPGNILTVVKYDPNRLFDQTRYYGASLAAYERLGRFRRYQLVYYNLLNAIFVQKDLVKDAPLIDVAAYPGRKSGWPMDLKDREWMDVV